MTKIRWTKILAEEAIQNKWGDLVKIATDYEHKTVDTVATFICKEHGEFNRTLYKVLNTKYPCPQCSPTGRKNWAAIEKQLHSIHNNIYNYSLVSKEGYDSTKPIKILCKEHGMFEKMLGSHKNGAGCPQCYEQSSRMTVNDFLFSAIQKHGNNYDYSQIYTHFKNSRTKIPIICKKHLEFWQTPSDHSRGVGCPTCANTSKGELIIRTFLLRHSIAFESQKTFSDFYSEHGTKYKYRYDFYIPSLNLLIEYDGMQHLKPNLYNQHDLENQHRIDNIKNQYAHNNGYLLLRISGLNNIEDTLTREILKG